MNGNQDVALSWAFTGITGVSAAASFDWVGMAFTIVCGLLTIAFTIWRWYRAAKKDGNISKEEIEELIDDIVHHVDDTADKVKDNIENNEIDKDENN